jgi:glyoxylase-like metal-dependent hydrolase (beta-lactamase superfamily II)
MFIKVSDRIFFLENEEYSDRPALGYVKGDKFSLMIDAGNSKKHVALFEESLALQNLKNPDYVALTHFHWDHTYGLSYVKAISLACHETQEHLKMMQKWTWDEPSIQHRLDHDLDSPFIMENIRKEFEELSEIRITLADQTFESSYSLNLGGIHAEIFKIDNGHTEDSVVIFIPEEKFVFLGDIIYWNPENEQSRQKFTSLLKYLQELNFEKGLTGHSGLYNKADLISELEEELLE